MSRARLLKLSNSVLIALAMSGALLATQSAGATWTNVYGPAAPDDYSSADQVELLPDGSSIVVGNFWGSFQGLASVDNFDLFAMRVNADGSIRWVRAWDPPESADPNDTSLPSLNPTLAGLVVDDNGRAYVLAGSIGFWIIDPDGTVIAENARFAASWDFEFRFAVALQDGFATLERYFFNSPVLTFRSRNGVATGSFSLPADASVNTAFLHTDGSGGVLLSFSVPSMAAHGTTDVAVMRLDSHAKILWSTLLKETDSSRPIVFDGDRLVFNTRASIDFRGITELSLSNGVLLSLFSDDTMFDDFLNANLPSGKCVTVNGSTSFVEPGSCDSGIFMGVYRGYWDLIPLGDGQFVTSGRLGAIVFPRLTDAVGVVRVTPSGLEPILATKVLNIVDKDNQLMDVDADPVTGRVIAVGRSNGTATIVPLAAAGTAVNALVVSDPWGHGFVDVPYTGWMAAPVTWLKASGLTTGCGTVTFCPERVMPREQLVTFLYRYNSSPAAGSPNPFTDVTRGAYFTSAIDWAYNTGVTTGVVADSLFGIGQSVTRAQAVTFLWRDAGKPTPSTPATFSDTLPGQFYTDAVAWAAETRVTTGYSDGRFGPFDPVTRAQFAAFLQRYDALNP